jgi:hypothetical protein
MLDCLANIENADLLKKIVWPIAPRQEPIGGGVYRKKQIVRKGDGLFGRWTQSNSGVSYRIK